MKKLLLLFITLQCFSSFAQQFNAKGRVTSSDGEILPGVSILLKGQQKGAITDFDGKFDINAKVGDILVFSYIGYKTQEIYLKDQKVVDVFMAVDQSSLDEVIVVGYGVTKQITTTGAISSIKGDEIKFIPTSAIQNTLAGRLPGFISVQRSGQPGKDASDFFIRGVSSLNPDGNQPLIIVDDVEYSYDQLQQIDVNEIESLSILKDASTTAIYGVKGANGVLVIKTRRGKSGKPRINVRAEAGLQSAIRKPEFLRSYDTAVLVNEAYKNDGLQPKFTQNDLDLFKSGADPYGHPDVDWYDSIFNDTAYQTTANVDISGGSEKVKYFFSGGVFSQNGLVKDFSTQNDDINTNYFYRRFNYRANLDYDISKTLSFRLDATSRFSDINEPHNKNVIEEIYNFSKIHPYSAPFLNPNGTYSYASDTQDKLPTINARLANGGYDRTRRTDSNILLGATQKLDMIAPGLSTTVRVNYASIEETRRSVIRDQFPTYLYTPLNDTYTIDPRKNYAYGSYMVTGGQNRSYQKLNIQAFLNYNKKFGNHNFESLFLYNRQTESSEAFVPSNFQGFTGKASYNYDEKYMIDLSAGYNGTDRFASNNRYGLFPAVGVAYNISKEGFFKKALPFIDYLKLKATYGLVGSDRTSGDQYLYRQVYGEAPGYWYGYQGEGGVSEGSLGNDNVTWEKARKFDVGFDLKLFDSEFSLQVDYFNEYRYDQLIRAEDIPQIIGIGVSPFNIAKTTNRGFDGQVSFQKNFNEVQFNSSLVFTYTKNKVLYKGEAQKAYEFLQETGRPIGQQFGYTYAGFYSEQEIANNNDSNPDNNTPVPVSDIPIQAGDLKYRDLNGDGVINNFDRGAIGKPNVPSTTLGLNLGVNYKGFSVKVLFQGSLDYSFSVIGTGIEPFKSQFQPLHLQRWTPETAESAEFPRLTSNPTTVNSPAAYMSDFWLVDAWYVRLKTVDLAYQLPDKWLPPGIKNTRVYVNGINLITWTGYDKYQQDPEINNNSNGDSYLNQRVINVGLQVGF